MPVAIPGRLLEVDVSVVVASCAAVICTAGGAAAHSAVILALSF